MNDQVVNLKTVSVDSDGLIVIQVALDHEVGQNRLNAVKGSVYGWIRRQAINAFEEIQKLCDQSGATLNPIVVRGKFESILAEWEGKMREPGRRNSIGENGKLPSCWGQAKSDLAGAIELGLDLRNDPEISQSKVKAFKKDESARLEKIKQQESLRKFAEETGQHIKPAEADKPKVEDPKPGVPDGTEDKPTEDPTPDEAAKAEGDNKQQQEVVQLGPKAPVTATHLTKEQLDRISMLVERLDVIAESGNMDKVNNLLQALDDQSKGQINKALAKLGRQAA